MTLSEDFLTSCLLVKFLAVVGFVQVFKLSFSLLSFVGSLVRPAVDLKKRYGGNSWALVSGGSSGIGKAFCSSLARDGFNVVMIARNAEKAAEVILELQRKHPLREFRVVNANLSDAMDKDNGIIHKVLAETADINISIVVNNAGVAASRKRENLHDNDREELIDMIRVNAAAPALLLLALIPRLMNRVKDGSYSHSCIINVTSFVGTIPTPFNEVYSGTKAFLDYLTQGLSMEYKNIDFVSLRPLGVDTPMMSEAKAEGLKGYVTAEECADACLRDLSRNVTTFGALSHRI